MRLRWTLALIAPLLAAGITLGWALDFPTLTGRVVDDANILDAATRSTLTQTLSDLESKTTSQLVVVTLKSLQGTSIEDYGYQLGRNWQIGQAGKNNGVLLIVAPNERKVRIEVGYGLEGTLTDAITRYMIEHSILPRFKANDFPGGIQRGVEDIVQALTTDTGELKQRATRSQPVNLTSDDFEKMIFMLFIVAIILLNFVLPFLHMFLISTGLAEKNPKSGFWYWLAQVPSSSSSSGGSGGGGFSSGSSGGGGFSGGGGSFGGGGSSGSW